MHPKYCLSHSAKGHETLSECWLALYNCTPTVSLADSFSNVRVNFLSKNFNPNIDGKVGASVSHVHIFCFTIELKYTYFNLLERNGADFYFVKLRYGLKMVN